MTIGELRKKLEMYKDDVEIFVGHYDDLHGDISYCDPTVNQTPVDCKLDKSGQWYYSLWKWYGKRRAKHTILVIE